MIVQLFFAAISIEILLQACTDDSADVRLNADECLNKIIKCLHETAIGKILVELYKDIKKVCVIKNRIWISLILFSILFRMVIHAVFEHR